MIKSEQLVVKSNQLIEARYEFSIWETRVFTKMVTMIEKDDNNFKNYRIDINQLMKFFHTKSHNDYDRIREVPESLMKKIIRIPYITESGEKRLFMTPLVASATIPQDGARKDRDTYVELSFHPDLKPYLLELKGRFLQYDISNVLRISSTYSVRIYELLKQYERIGFRVFKLKELKEILGIQDKYERYTHFKTGIIINAQKNLKKHTDIVFDFEEIKKGRSVDSIKFLIFQNPNGKKQKKSKDRVELANLFTEENVLIKSLLKEGVSYEMAQSLIEKLGAVVVQKELSFAKSELIKKKGIKNPAGFLIRMIEKESFTKEEKYKQEQTDKIFAATQAQEKERVLQQKQIEDLRVEYTQLRNQAVNDLLKGKSEKTIKALIGECAQEEPFIKKAIARAEKTKDKATADDFKYLLLAKTLSEEKLRNFDAYLASEYQLKLQRDERGEYLISL